MDSQEKEVLVKRKLEDSGMFTQTQTQALAEIFMNPEADDVIVATVAGITGFSPDAPKSSEYEQLNISAKQHVFNRFMAKDTYSRE